MKKNKNASGKKKLSESRLVEISGGCGKGQGRQNIEKDLERIKGPGGRIDRGFKKRPSTFKERLSTYRNLELTPEKIVELEEAWHEGGGMGPTISSHIVQK
jgi:hypothetical protein